MRSDLAYYESCLDLGELTPEEQIELAQVLRNLAVRKAFGKILERANEIPERLALTVNLLTDAGRLDGIMLQAQYRACIKLFDDLLTQAGIGVEEEPSK
jgi:hypothetical protein